MMDHQGTPQGRWMLVDLDLFVPQDHLLRRIKSTVDFTFIYGKVKHLYAQRGRPSVDPVVLVKMLLLGYLYGIRSERQLEQEVHMNLCYRWFLGLQLDERVPDHSTLSQNRRRRFAGTAVFQDIFDGIVQQCMAAGLVDGQAVLTDSTHIKANASGERTAAVVVSQKPRAYLAELEAEADRLEEERRPKGRGGGRRGPKPRPRNRQRQVESSVTDPDAGLLNRPGKPSGFHYLSHTTLDSMHGVILDVHVTAGNVNDHEPYVQRISRVKARFNLPIREAAADKGYDFVNVHRQLQDLGVTTYIPKAERKAGAGERFRNHHFVYDPALDQYRCPAGHRLRFTHVNRLKFHRIYAARTADCRGCPLRAQCISTATRFRTLHRPMHQEAADAAHARGGTARYRELQRKRRTWCEGTFALMKACHGLGRAMRRGLWTVTEQVLLTAVVVNLKRLACLFWLTPYDWPVASPTLAPNT
jgi:transposase